MAVLTLIEYVTDLNNTLMKTRIIIGMLMTIGAGAFAQEYDDMYFRSKDREKQNATIKSSKSEEVYASNSYETFKKKNFKETTMLDEYTNPTDSYSARNVNPEYISRSYSEQASEVEQNYFVDGYTSALATTNAFDYNQGYYYNGWNSSQMNTMNMYNTGWYGPSFYNGWRNNPWAWNDPWMNPHMGMGMNPYMGMGMNPFMGSGWNMSFGYGMGSGWGNPWNSGWNMGMGYMWGNPYYNSMRWPSSIWYCPSGSAATVVSDSRRATYAKPVSRSGNYAAYNPNASAPTSAVTTSTSRSAGNNSNGRVSSSQQRDEHYNPRRRAAMQYEGYNYSNSNTRGNRTDGGSSGFLERNNMYRSNSSSGYNSGPSRSSGFSSGSSSGYSAPARSSGATSTGRTRGGN